MILACSLLITDKCYCLMKLYNIFNVSIRLNLTVAKMLTSSKPKIAQILLVKLCIRQSSLRTPRNV